MAININPTLLRNSANNLETVISTLNDVKNGMNKAHGDISSCWQSEYTDQYLETFDAVYSNVSRLITEINNIQRNLRIAADKAEDAEREAKRVLTNIIQNNSNSTDIVSTVAGVSVAQHATQQINEQNNK